MKYIKWIAAASITLSSFVASATSLDPNDANTHTINDSYNGAGGVNQNDHHYDILGGARRYDVDKMLVARQMENGKMMLTVDIFTSFWNDINRNGSGIFLGDLFMATTDDGSNPWDPNGLTPYKGDRFSNSGTSNTGTNWNWAYDISGEYYRDDSGWGALKGNFNNTDTSTSSDHGVAGRDDQSVTLDWNSGTQYNGFKQWGFGGSNDQYYKNGNSYRNLRLHFDVTGTSLATANQIAFRWAMTCANDIIEGLVTFNSDDSTKVPEPQSILLMLLGGLGLAASRKKAIK